MLRFFKGLTRYVHVRTLRTLIPGPGFDGYAHQLFGVRIAGDQIDACMVYPCTLETVLGKPVQNEVFGKVTGDLGVARTLDDL